MAVSVNVILLTGMIDYLHVLNSIPSKQRSFIKKRVLRRSPLLSKPLQVVTGVLRENFGTETGDKRGEE